MAANVPPTPFKEEFDRTKESLEPRQPSRVSALIAEFHGVSTKQPEKQKEPEKATAEAVEKPKSEPVAGLHGGPKPPAWAQSINKALDDKKRDALDKHVKENAPKAVEKSDDRKRVSELIKEVKISGVERPTSIGLEREFGKNINDDRSK